LHEETRNRKMPGSREFIEQLQAVTEKFISEIVSNSIFKNQLGKLNKDIDSLTADDCRILIENVVKSASLFVTKERAGEFETRLNTIFKDHFPHR
jgi:hypothetical protein